MSSVIGVARIAFVFKDAYFSIGGDNEFLKKHLIRGLIEISCLTPILIIADLALTILNAACERKERSFKSEKTNNIGMVNFLVSLIIASCTFILSFENTLGRKINAKFGKKIDELAKKKVTRFTAISAFFQFYGKHYNAYRQRPK